MDHYPPNTLIIIIITLAKKNGGGMLNALTEVEACSPRLFPQTVRLESDPVEKF